jgi:hypothetical protein
MSTPIIDITEPNKQRLDILRGLKLGADAQLDLLKLSATQGYDVLASYTDGWAMAQGDWRTPDQIEIADVDSDRAVNIAKASAFGIPLLGLIYRLNAEGRHAPATIYRRVWLCYVSTTGEKWPQS